MNFQPVGTRGQAHVSDCKRYYLAAIWQTELWDAWLVKGVGEGPNDKLAARVSLDQAQQACAHHQRQHTNTTPVRAHA